MITVNKNWIRLIGIVGCTVWMASCKQAPDAGVKSSYAVMQIEPTDKELSSSYSATIRGRQDIDIYPQVSGTIEKLCVTEGQKVRRGQLLFIIAHCFIIHIAPPLFCQLINNFVNFCFLFI